MNDPAEKSDSFRTLVSALIAVVTVVGAIIAWRTTVALGDAGGARTSGLLALVEKEDATTRANINVLAILNSYVAYVRDDSLAKAYQSLADANPERTDLSDSANAFYSAANRTLYQIPQPYLDRNDNLDRERLLGETIAEYSKDKDVEPQAHFLAADTSRLKAESLLISLVLLGVALVLLTLADAIENPLRYLCFLWGLGIFSIGTLAMLLIELFGVPTGFS